jgi:hypothetical protein
MQPNLFNKIRLTQIEKGELATNYAQFQHLKFSSTNPLAFTEQGSVLPH